VAMIKAKGEGAPVAAPKAQEPGKVIDLMEALKRSVEMAQGQRKAGLPRRSALGAERKAAAGGMRERPQ